MILLPEELKFMRGKEQTGSKTDSIKPEIEFWKLMQDLQSRILKHKEKRPLYAE